MPGNNQAINPLTGLPFGQIGESLVKPSNTLQPERQFQPQETRQTLTNEPIQNFTDYGVSMMRGNDIINARVDLQPTSEQAFNAIIGGFASGALTAVEDLSYLPNILTQFVDNDYEKNAIAETMQSLKQDLGEELPIYRSGKGTWSWDDGAIVWDSLKGILDSAVGFGLPGLGIAGAVSKGVEATAKATRGMKLLGALSKSPAMQQAISSVGSGLIMNDLEGTMMGVELYDNLISQGVDKETAAQKANEFKQWNRVFAITDALQVHGLFKGALPGGTRNMLNPRGIVKNLGKLSEENLLVQGLKEGAEEIGQNVIQSEMEYEGLVKSGKQDLADKISPEKDLFNRVIDLATSDKALYEGMLGFLGGGPQRVMSDILAGNYGEKGKAYDKAYNEQQELIAKTKQDLDKTLIDFTETDKLLNEAINKGDDALVETLKESKLNNLMVQHFNNGTTDFLENQLNDIANLSPEQAKERGFTDSYKQEAQKALNNLHKSEKQWNNLLEYNNKEEVFSNIKKGELLNKQYIFAKADLSNKLLKVNNEGQRILESKTKDSSSIFDINTRILNDSEDFAKQQKETLEEIQSTKAYKEFTEAKEKVRILQSKLKENDKEYSKITSDEYQANNTFEKRKERLFNEIQNVVNKAKEQTQNFKQQVESKGYSLDKIDNKSGIFVRHKDGTYLLKRDENGNIILRNLDSNKTIHIGTAEDFNKFIATNKLQVLSREEYKILRKNQEVVKYRQAEIQAIEALIKDVKEKGVKKKEELVKTERELQDKIKELEDLKKEISKGYVSAELRTELQTLVNELQEAINQLKDKVNELQAERDTLAEFWTLYKEQLDKLKEFEDSFTDFNRLYNEEKSTRDLVQDSLDSELPFTLEEVDNLIKSLEKVIADNLEKIDTYQEYLDVIKSFLKRDSELRDFLSSMDFNDAFNQKYPKEVRQRITPRFIKEYFEEKKLDPTTTNAELNKLNELLDLVETNPDYINEMNSLLAQKAELKRLKDNIKFNSENAEFTTKQIEFLTNQLTYAKTKLEKLIDQKEKLEYLEKNTLAAIYNIKEKARNFYNKNTVLSEEEKADPESFEPEKTTKDKWVKENAKKGDWNTTTGQVIVAKYDAKTDTYEDVIGEDGLPLFTDKQAQIVWAKYLDDNSLELKNGKYKVKFHLHNPNGNSALDVQISANIDQANREVGNDLYALITDEKGNLIDVDGKYIFTGIHKTETLFPSEGEVRLLVKEKLVGKTNPGLANYLQDRKGNPSITINGITKSAREWEKEDNWEEIQKNEITKILNKEKETFDNFRKRIKEQISEGKDVYSDITDVSDGVPYLDNKLKSIKPFLTDEFDLSYDTKTGEFIATTTDGKKIPIQGDLLNEQEVNTVIALLQYALPKDSETFVGTIKLPKGETYQYKDTLEIFPRGANKPNVLNALIYYGRNKQPKKFNIWGTQQINFMDENDQLHVVSKEDLHNPNSEGFIKLREFLKTKRLNFNRGFLNKDGRYYQPIINKKGELDWKIYANFKDYVKEKGQTYLHNKGKQYPLFTNRYVTFGPVSENKAVPEKPITSLNLGRLLSAEDMIGEFDVNDDFVEDMKEFQELSPEQDSGLSAEEFGFEAPKKETSIEEKKADIERRRQEAKLKLQKFVNDNSDLNLISPDNKQYKGAIADFTSIDTKYDAELKALEQNKPKNPMFKIERKQPKGKERTVKISEEDALKRLKELIKEGIVDKNCS